MKSIYIVAEIGCNHNGSKDLAKKMVLEAKKCGVNAVKFQTFNSSELISKYAPKAEYQIKTTGNDESQLEMTKKLELSCSDYLELSKYALSLGLDVFSTPFDMKSIDFLASIGQRIWKIPSGEITNLPYLEKIGFLPIENKKIILSSGMATIAEIKDCLDVLKKCGLKSNQIILLHCNTEYPTPDEDVNILAINDLKQNFNDIEIGFSDHSSGFIAGIGAAMLDIVMIEKHFTLDKTMPGPDHKASVDPFELKSLCDGIRRIEKMKGSGLKIVTNSEKKNKIVARKSIVARIPIKKGELFSKENLTCKRPGNGISPMRWYDVLGLKSEQDFDEDQVIVDSRFDSQK